MRKIYGVNFIESVNQSVTCLLVDKAVVIANPSTLTGQNRFATVLLPHASYPIPLSLVPFFSHIIHFTTAFRS